MSHRSIERRDLSMLLVGPTGSGKTPLGRLLESRGLRGLSCRHFDFGEELRRVVSKGDSSETFSLDDILLVRRLIQEGSLLEKEEFSVAERILSAFWARGIRGQNVLLVLNGLPRHLDQARQMESLVEMKAVVHLACSEETVIQRIRENIGGDREGRMDDGEERIRARFLGYRQRTLPMLSYYRERGIRIETIDIATHTRHADVWLSLQKLW